MVNIAFVGREGRTIVESADGELIEFGEIAGAIAAVLAPDLPDEASENAKLVRAMERLAVLEPHEKRLKALAMAGEVPLVADCRLRLPVAPPVGEMLRRAFVPLRWVSNYCLEWGIGICDADAQALDYSEQQRFKAEQGRYTLEEAAKEMVVNVSADEKGILGNLIDAAIAGELPVYQPGKKQRYRPQVVLGFYEEAYWDDLNQWLAANEKRISWRFTAPGVLLNKKPINQQTEESTEKRLVGWRSDALEHWPEIMQLYKGNPSASNVAKYLVNINTFRKIARNEFMWVPTHQYDGEEKKLTLKTIQNAMPELKKIAAERKNPG